MADPSSGGAILGEACHFVDLMYWLLGSEPVSVSAYTLPTGEPIRLTPGRTWLELVPVGNLKAL